MGTVRTPKSGFGTKATVLGQNTELSPLMGFQSRSTSGYQSNRNRNTTKTTMMKVRGETQKLDWSRRRRRGGKVLFYMRDAFLIVLFVYVVLWAITALLSDIPPDNPEHKGKKGKHTTESRTTL